MLKGTGIHSAAGDKALIEAASLPADWVMAAIVGAAGLAPTLTAVKQGRTVALANKECLVTAGDLFMREVASSGCTLLSADSEHSAVRQAMQGVGLDAISRIVLTASGGPFRTWPLDRLKSATSGQALKHPNWSMGPKITIDSATLMNKGLELIEAHHLFACEPERLGVIVHPQSIVHCLLECRDGSVLAHLGSPDMRLPIACALDWPERRPTPVARLDLTKLGQLTFEEPDEVRFPALAIARAALRRGGGACAVLNAANEVAVEAFLKQRIGFLDIASVVNDTLEVAEGGGSLAAPASLEEAKQLDLSARQIAVEFLSRRAA
jgi:1-deoxy-D-xylulose-5-phosphate reductoisomerase